MTKLRYVFEFDTEDGKLRIVEPESYDRLDGPVIKPHIRFSGSSYYWVYDDEGKLIGNIYGLDPVIYPNEECVGLTLSLRKSKNETV